MDEISQGPDKGPGLSPAARWLTGAAAVLVGVAAVLTLTRSAGHHATAAPATPAVRATPNVSQAVPATAAQTPATSAPAPAAGTVLLTCDSANPGELKAGWRAGSLRVGTLWFVGGSRLGYVRIGRAKDASRTPADQTLSSREVQMLVHVDAGATVVVRADAATRPYFQFVDGYGWGSEYQSADGDEGFTFVPCSRGASASGYYDLGFAVVPGRAAGVEVWTSPSARPVWLTFAAPARAS